MNSDVDAMIEEHEAKKEKTQRTDEGKEKKKKSKKKGGDKNILKSSKKKKSSKGKVFNAEQIIAKNELKAVEETHEMILQAVKISPYYTEVLEKEAKRRGVTKLSKEQQKEFTIAFAKDIAAEDIIQIKETAKRKLQDLNDESNKKNKNDDYNLSVEINEEVDADVIGVNAESQSQENTDDLFMKRITSEEDDDVDAMFTADD